MLMLDPAQLAALAAVLRALRHQANEKAEESWQKRKGPMAAYWRAVSTYARHLAHALARATDNTGREASVAVAEPEPDDAPMPF